MRPRICRKGVGVKGLSENLVRGAQEQSAYNGHFESICYHPLFVFNQAVTAWRPNSGRAMSAVRAGGTTQRLPCPTW